MMKRTRRAFLQVVGGAPFAAAVLPLPLARLLVKGGDSGRQSFAWPPLDAGGVSATAPRQGGLVTIDASKPLIPPHACPFQPLNAKAPDGREVGANSHYLTLDGDPWLPVMGEFHFSRYPDSFWEEELLKMKAGGIQIVSTYVFWIHHEEVEGEFDWSGRRNLRQFVELCRKHHLYTFVRIGPWSHGEARNGGFPDWLLHQCPVLRRNDPGYLGYVRTYFGQIGKQLSGLYWKDGGSVIGVQLENEYMLPGPGAGAEHIAELKKIAQESDINSPLYTVTGWQDPQFPPQQVIPVFSGYPYQSWPRSICELPPSSNYFFTAIRDDQAVGANLQALYPINEEVSHFPYLTAELGGGMETSYHRRPVVHADDVAAFVLCKLGSGANLLGYYVYHGGSNPQGKLTTLQESQATGYPNDLPVASYDYQAPIGEFGQVRRSYGALKAYHLFLQDFGSTLAPMDMILPDMQSASIYDRQTLRLAIRTDGNRGFVFINNYEQDHPLPEHADMQIDLKLSSETLKIPSKPVTLPSGAYSIWPVNLVLDGALLKYATAQLLCKVREGETAVYFFFAWPGIEPEFRWEEQSVASVEATHSVRHAVEGQIHINGITPGSSVAVALKSRMGKSVRIVVLTREQANNCFRLRLGGSEHVFISPGSLFSDGERLRMRARDVRDLSFSAFPALPGSSAGAQLREAGQDGIFTRYRAVVAPKVVSLRLHELRSSSPLGPPKMGTEVALAPTDADFDHAAQWRVVLPPGALDGLSDLYLQIAYVGDVARLYAGARLLDDNFYNGATWEVGLKRFASEDLSGGLTLEILPLRQHAPIYMPASAWPPFPPGGEAAAIRAISASPEYEVTIKFPAGEQYH